MDNKTSNSEGAPIKVPLGKYGQKGHALVDRDDWEFLQKLGVSTAWNLSTYGTVIAGAARAPGRNVRIGRVLLDLGAGKVVKYRDGDPKNLTRDNLYVEDGSATVRDRLFLTPSHEQRKRRRKECVAL